MILFLIHSSFENGVKLDSPLMIWKARQTAGSARHLRARVSTRAVGPFSQTSKS